MNDDSWDSQGAVFMVDQQRVWCRVDGPGQGAANGNLRHLNTTFLHGFPTSSLDWRPLLDALAVPSDSHDGSVGRRRIIPDLLGYGASDRPASITFPDQVEMLLGLWRQLDVERTILVAHDYSVSVVQEILARIVAGSWPGPIIQGVVLLNGGVTWSGNRPLPIQQVLRVPVVGRAIAQAARFPLFERNMQRICTRPPPDLQAHWQRMVDGPNGPGTGKTSVAILSSYHDERRENEARWMAALAHAPVPVRMVWGMADPIAAGQVAIVRRRAPSVATTPLANAGHYPHWDDPRAVARAILAMETVAGSDVPPLWPASKAAA